MRKAPMSKTQSQTAIGQYDAASTAMNAENQLVIPCGMTGDVGLLLSGAITAWEHVPEELPEASEEVLNLRDVPVAELTTVDGVGDSTADKIKEAVSGDDPVETLEDVSNVGPSTADKIRDADLETSVDPFKATKEEVKTYDEQVTAAKSVRQKVRNTNADVEPMTPPNATEVEIGVTEAEMQALEAAAEVVEKAFANAPCGVQESVNKVARFIEVSAMSVAEVSEQADFGGFEQADVKVA